MFNGGCWYSDFIILPRMAVRSRVHVAGDLSINQLDYTG